MPQLDGGGQGARLGYGAQTKAAAGTENRLLDVIPFIVAGLIAAHLLAFVSSNIITV